MSFPRSIFLIQFKESPRFLVIKKQFDRAKEVLKEIAMINDRPMPTDGWLFEDEIRVN